MKRLLVKENRKLERDTSSKAILSNDLDSYRAALARRAARKNRQKEFDALKNKVDDLTNLIQNLIEKIDK